MLYYSLFFTLVSTGRNARFACKFYNLTLIIIPPWSKHTSKHLVPPHRRAWVHRSHLRHRGCRNEAPFRYIAMDRCGRHLCISGRRDTMPGLQRKLPYLHVPFGNCKLDEESEEMMKRTKNSFGPKNRNATITGWFGSDLYRLVACGIDVTTSVLCAWSCKFSIVMFACFWSGAAYFRTNQMMLVSAFHSGSFFPAVFYGFYCHNILKIVYLSAISAIGAATVKVLICSP